MKRLRLLPILFGLLFSVVPLLAQQTDFRPDYGVLNGRRYMNGYFGFSYRFPEGWTGSALRYPAVGESKMYPLFSANPQSASTSDLRYVSINADYLAPNTTIKTPKDFLELAQEAQAGPLGEFEALHTDKRYVFGGKQFYRVDMRAKASPGTPVFYQTLICTIQRGYAVTFSFMAANNDDMEELVRTMESLSFVEPGSIGNPATAVAQQQAPAVSNVPSTTAARAPSTILPGTRPSEVSAQPPTAQPPLAPENAAVPPATSSSPTAAPTVKTPQSSKTVAQKAAARVSTSASEVPTAAVGSNDVPLNQLATAPAIVTVEEAAPLQSTTTTASAIPTAANTPPASPPPGSASVTTTPPSRAAAPSTLIPSGRTPQRTYRTTEPAPSTNVPAASTTPSSTEPPRPETTVPAAVPVPPAAVAPSAPTQPVEQTAPLPKPDSKPQAASELANSQPAPPVVENTTNEPKAVPAAMTTVAAPPPAPSPGPAAPAMRVTVPPAELEQYIIRKTSPVYPMIAKAAGVQGLVVLDIVVDSKGNVQKVTTVSGSSLLTRAAEEALRQWRFRPYLVDGNPVEMESLVSMSFRLSR